MTPAELKVVRQSLGLSMNWFANRMRVSFDTAKRWESVGPVPKDAAVSINVINEALNDCAYRSIDRISKQDPKQTVLMLIYKTEDELYHDHPEMNGIPVPCYNMLISRIYEALKAKHLDIVIAYSHDCIFA
jgi:transcriptional regulator with XRE-family HTH domain